MAALRCLLDAFSNCAKNSSTSLLSVFRSSIASGDSGRGRAWADRDATLVEALAVAAFFLEFSGIASPSSSRRLAQYGCAFVLMGRNARNSYWFMAARAGWARTIRQEDRGN